MEGEGRAPELYYKPECFLQGSHASVLLRRVRELPLALAPPTDPPTDYVRLKFQFIFLSYNCAQGHRASTQQS